MTKPTLTRRSFVGSIGTGLAALTPMAGSLAAEAQLIYKQSDWKFAEFDKLLKNPARYKQVYDVHGMNSGHFLHMIKNSINGLQFGFGIAAAEIKIASCTHGTSNVINFNDAMWQKYRLGEFIKANDPETKQPATRNIYYKRAGSSHSDKLEDPNSTWQDQSVENLMTRGLTLLCCHNATTIQAGTIIQQFKLSATPEEVVADLQANTLPGVITVPAMVAAIAVLQLHGRYTYISGE